MDIFGVYSLCVIYNLKNVQYFYNTATLQKWFRKPNIKRETLYHFYSILH